VLWDGWVENDDLWEPLDLLEIKAAGIVVHDEYVARLRKEWDLRVGGEDEEYMLRELVKNLNLVVK
jgi:hypothetical protein